MGTGWAADEELLYPGGNGVPSDYDVLRPLVRDCSLSNHHNKSQRLLQQPNKESTIRRLVNEPGPNGSTALLMAIGMGAVDDIKALCAAGADPNKEALEFDDRKEIDEKKVWCPIHCAVHSKKLDVLDTLLSLGANPNCRKHTDGGTALHVAAIKGEPVMSQSLLRAGGDPSLTRTDGSGTTALHDAIEQGHLGTAQVLLRHGCNPNVAAFDDGSTPLHFAVRYRTANLNMIQLLVAFGANTAATDLNNRTPKDWAVAKGRANVAAWLDAVEGWSALQVAVGCRFHGDAAAALRHGMISPPEGADDYDAVLATASDFAPWDAAPAVCRKTVRLACAAYAGWSVSRHWLHHVQQREVVLLVMLIKQRLKNARQHCCHEHHNVAGAARVGGAHELGPPNGLQLPWMPPELWFSMLGFVLRSHFPLTTETASTTPPAVSRTRSHGTKVRPLCVLCVSTPTPSLTP